MDSTNLETVFGMDQMRIFFGACLSAAHLILVFFGCFYLFGRVAQPCKQLVLNFIAKHGLVVTYRLGAVASVLMFTAGVVVALASTRTGLLQHSVSTSTGSTPSEK